MLEDTQKWKEQFEIIIDLYKGRVMNMLHRLLPNKSDVEDIAQEVFIRVYKGLPYFKHQSKFTTWLYRIVHNVAVSELRKSKPQLTTVDTLEKFPATHIQNNPSEALTKKQVKEKLSKALDNLPESYRMVLLLYYMEEVSYAEISRILDLPIGTVKTYLHRGKKLLRQSLFNLSNTNE